MSLVVVAKAWEPICGACKTLYGHTCCELALDEGLQTPLTWSEARRIARWVVKPFEVAVTVQHLGVATRQRYHRETPFGSLVKSGIGLFLPLTEQRQCVYLGKSGCTIVAAKPHICAMYPFSFSNAGWTFDAGACGTGACLAHDSSLGDVAKAMALFGLAEGQLDRIYRRWQSDLGLHAMQLAQWRKRGQRDQERIHTPGA